METPRLAGTSTSKSCNIESLGCAIKLVLVCKSVDVKFRDTKYNVTYESKLDKPEFDFAVLVNEHTASASEILASAI